MRTSADIGIGRCISSQRCPTSSLAGLETLGIRAGHLHHRSRRSTVSGSFECGALPVATEAAAAQSGKRQQHLGSLSVPARQHSRLWRCRSRLRIAAGSAACLPGRARLAFHRARTTGMIRTRSSRNAINIPIKRNRFECVRIVQIRARSSGSDIQPRWIGLDLWIWCGMPTAPRIGSVRYAITKCLPEQIRVLISTVPGARPAFSGATARMRPSVAG